MAIYSTLLARGSAVASLGVTLYTAPASGVVVVVRDVVLAHTDGGSRRMIVQGLSGSSYAWLAVIDALAPYTTYQWKGRQLLEPGEQLLLGTSATGVVHWRVSGYVLGS